MAHFTSLIFPMGFFPILLYGKKFHGFFVFFKIANFCKNNNDINSVDIQLYD